MASYCLLPGESIAGINEASNPHPGSPKLSMREGDYTTISRNTAIRSFYNGCREDDAEAAFTRLTPERFDLALARATRSAWRDIPSHYVKCARDEVLSPKFNR